jgi:hypothetical protein
LEKYGVDAVKLGEEFLMNEGHGSFNDYIEHVSALYGATEAGRVRDRMDELAAQTAKTIGGTNVDSAYRQRVIAANLPRYALIAGPDAEFLKGIEHALGMLPAMYFDSGGPTAGYEASVEYLSHLDGLFAKRGIPYRVHDHEIVWAGDRGHRAVVVEPALQALDDPRLGGARSEFEAALSHVRAGTQKDLEDAIEEAGKAVESAMKVLIAETGTTPPRKETAWPLFEALRDAGHLPAYLDQFTQAAARIRNEAGGHGAGSQPRQIDEDIAVAAVNAAASAIVLIGGRLP